MSRSVLVRQLEQARAAFCGIGTRKIKLRLNKCSAVSPVARAFRLALEIEDCSTQGKKYRRSEWSDRNYFKKSLLIEQLIALCREQKWNHGKQKSDSYFPPFIVYFELPHCEQISFHTSLTKPDIVQEYDGKWDEKRNSTLAKLEAAINVYFEEGQGKVFKF